MEDKDNLNIDRAKENYDNIKIPHNIDDYIIQGMKKARKSKKTSIVKTYSSIAAALLLAVFFTSIRISPAFASYISSIPGFDHIVKIINNDKGLKSAVEHGLLQDVEAWDEHEGIKLAIEKIIADDSRIVIFYAIENNSSYDYLYLRNVDFKDNNGERVSASYTYGQDRSGGVILRGKIDMSLHEATVIPEEIIMDANFVTKIIDSGTTQYKEIDKILESTWQLKFSIDRENHKYEKIVYPLNEVIEIEGQKIEFIEAVIHPTRTELMVKYDPNNTKKIFGFDDLKLIDGYGIEYGTLTNTFTETHIDENTKKLYMESSYFSNSKELYIRGSSIRALDRDNLNLVVDLKEKKILNRPDDKIEFEDIVFRDGINRFEMIFKLQMDENPEYNKIFRASFGNVRYKDVEASTGVGVSFRKDSWLVHVIIQFDDILADVDRIELDITDYPARLIKEFSVRVK